MHFSLRAKTRLRSVAALAVLGLAVAGLAGCSSSSTKSSSDPGSATSGNVTWWGWTPTPTAAAQYIAAFNKKYPHIKVTFKEVNLTDWDAALRPALASSSGPDVFNITPGARMTQYGGYALDMTSTMVKALGSDWKSKVSQIGVDGMTYQGKLAGISAGSVAAGSMWINQDLFTKYNVTPPKTMSQWVNDCAIFKRNGVTCFVQGAAQAAFDRDQLQSLSNQIKPGIWTKASQGKAKWTDPAIVKALTEWKSLFTNGVMQPGALGIQQLPDANNLFFTGKVAMIMMGTWNTQYSTMEGITPAMSAAGVANPKPFAIVPIPYPALSGSGSTNKYQLYGDSDYGLAVNSKSTQKAAATTFAAWLGTSQTAQQLIANILDDIPALKDVKPDWNSITMPDKSAQLAPIQSLYTQAAAVTEPRIGLLSNDVITAIGVAATTVAAGQATPTQAAQTLQQSAEASGVVFK